MTVMFIAKRRQVYNAGHLPVESMKTILSERLSLRGCPDDDIGKYII